jgi:8-oxo-dGTP diphosphatase
MGERFTLRVAVYLFLIKDDKILLSRRYKTGWMDGRYSLVAGHVDEGETISEAMIRETFEETKVKINKEDLIPATVIHRKSSDMEYIDFFFVSEKWEGEPTIGEPEKCDQLKWFPISELPDELLPFIKDAFEKYKKGISFFESGW